MTFDAPENANYAATIVQVPEPQKVPGLDNLVGIPLFGYQALTQKDGIKAGDLRVLFTAETQLGIRYCEENNLYREAALNSDANVTGYLEINRRVKAIRLRKNTSNALLMPLDSLEFTGYDLSTLKAGDTFDTLKGHRICQKYEIARKAQQQGQPKVRKQVDEKLFPKHLDSEHLFRNLHYLREPKHVVVTQKLHGTSWRGGNIPVNRSKGWLERLVNRLGVKTPDTEYKHVYGSRNVVKGRSDNNHYYDTDLWAAYGASVFEGRIPENFMVFGELIGWVSADGPIQKGYTYNCAPGQAELYVYRVATVNGQGIIADLSWEGVKNFCASLGIKTVPELFQGVESALDEQKFITEFSEDWLDIRLNDEYGYNLAGAPVPLSDKKLVDEGVCVRIEGQIPRVLKAKSPLFLEHETRALDAGDIDVESAA